MLTMISNSFFFFEKYPFFKLIVASFSRTLLHLASINGHVPVVKALLEHGANPNTRDRFGHSAIEVNDYLLHSFLFKRENKQNRMRFFYENLMLYHYLEKRKHMFLISF